MLKTVWKIIVIRIGYYILFKYGGIWETPPPGPNCYYHTKGNNDPHSIQDYECMFRLDEEMSCILFDEPLTYIPSEEADGRQFYTTSPKKCHMCYAVFGEWKIYNDEAKIVDK
jgi:hypothetical protein